MRKILTVYVTLFISSIDIEVNSNLNYYIHIHFLSLVFMQNSKVILLVSVLLGILLIGTMVVVGVNSKDPITLPIRVEEFSDFQCPACQHYYPAAAILKSEAYQGKVEFVFKHFPLESIHDRAYSAAVASEAAREQGKFYEYHDVLFENQPAFSDENLLKYAQDLGLDIAKFQEDYMNNPEVKSRVDADMAEAASLGLNSTPTFLVNGKKISVSNRDMLIQTIDKYIAKAEQK
jgi:protein-disulfide isomerase